MALRRAQVACELKPDVANYLACRGIAAYRLGEFQAALETLTAAESSAGVTHILFSRFDNRSPRRAYNPAMHRLFIAMCRYRLGEKDVARRLLGEVRPAIEKDDTVLFAAWLREAEELMGE